MTGVPGVAEESRGAGARHPQAQERARGQVGAGESGGRSGGGGQAGGREGARVRRGRGRRRREWGGGGAAAAGGPGGGGAEADLPAGGGESAVWWRAAAALRVRQPQRVCGGSGGAVQGRQEADLLE